MNGLKLIDREKAKKFYDTDLFRERNEPPKGLTDADVLNHALSADVFIGYYVDGKLVLVTACYEVKSSNDKVIEVHTLVLPEYRTVSVQALIGQIEFFKKVGVDRLLTSTPIKHKRVKNYLVKRLGFEETEYKNGSFFLSMKLGENNEHSA